MPAAVDFDDFLEGVAMRRYSLAAVMALWALVALPSLVQAAVVVRMSMDDLVHNSSLIVRGKVTVSESFQDKERGRIFTRHTVTVLETLKGTKADTVTVVTLGGELPDIGQIVPGEAELKVGEEVVLCLENTAGGFSVVGMAQGKFVVDHSKTPCPLVRDTRGLLYVGEKGKSGSVSKLSGMNPGEVDSVLTIDTLRTLIHRDEGTR